MSRGVVRKPPPTPNMPESTPTTKPRMTMNSQLTDWPAIGR
jgi:hypothetical protein